jgi:hypothetical protein
MSKVLVEFNWDYGRVGEIKGLFITTEKELKESYGRRVDLGEALGNNSEVCGDLEEKDFKILSKEKDKIEWLENLMNSKTISGYNPLNCFKDFDEEYFDDEDFDDDDFEE